MNELQRYNCTKSRQTDGQTIQNLYASWRIKNINNSVIPSQHASITYGNCVFIVLLTEWIRQTAPCK